MTSIRTSLWFLWLLSFSLLLFLRGFLLTKIEIEKFSSCHDYNHGNCWSNSRYKRAVLVLVDALRHDFTVFNDSVSNPEPWQNKMPVFKELLTQFPDQTRHMEFIADPPTATFLRLKGLTTGGLPTLVDLGSNFGASEVSEDSWVKQMSLNSKKMILLGDDTWMSIYGQYFHRSFPFPSFDVWDLHTVDNGVWKHLLPQMKTSDWDVIVAHFLGVDHAGHRYHVKHPQLKDKLVQINSWIEEIISSVEEDTVLFIFGDHGMTSSGDHGGETVDEVTSTLFVYSGSKLGEMSVEEALLFDNNKIFQTDLVPTLTMLLGVPVPYSSLGSVIPFLFLTEDAEDSRLHLQRVMNTNMNQVFRYIDTYSIISTEFSASDISRIKSQVADINRRFSDNESLYSLDLVREMLQVIRAIRDLCSEHWAQFNLPLMLLALLIMGMLSLALLLSTEHVLVKWWLTIPVIPVLIISYDTLSLWSGVTHAITVVLTLSSVVLTFYSPVRLKLCSVLSSAREILSSIFSKKGILSFSRWTDLAGIVVICLMSFGFTTNSYVLVEDYISVYFFGTLLLVNYISHHGFTLKRDDIFYTLTAMLCSRASTIFMGCREEQFWCTRTWWLSDEVTEVVKSRRYFGSVSAFGGVMYGLYRFQRHHGCLISGVLKFIHCLIHPVQCTLVTVYWALSSSPTKLFTDAQVCWFPRCVYILTILSVCIIVYKPSTVYLQDKRGATSRLFGGVACYSAPSLSIYASVLPTCALLLQHPLAPTLALLTVQLLCLTALLHRRSVAFKLVISHVTMLQYFYATGHQAAVQQFDWNAAFVGFTSHPYHVVPALLIVVRTLMCSILVTLFLPTLLLYSPAVDDTEINSPAQSGDETDSGSTSNNTAQFQYYTDPSLLTRLLHSTLHTSTALFLFKCVWCCGACYIHRRHLMIWNIFTPRMIIESCMSVCTSVCLVGVSALISRTQDLITGYLDRNLKSN